MTPVRQLTLEFVLQHHWVIKLRQKYWCICIQNISHFYSVIYFFILESLFNTHNSSVEKILILSMGAIPNKVGQKKQAWEGWETEWHWLAWKAVPSMNQIMNFYLKHHSYQSTKENIWKRSSLFGVFIPWEIGQHIFYC